MKSINLGLLLCVCLTVGCVLPNGGRRASAPFRAPNAKLHVYVLEDRQPSVALPPAISNELIEAQRLVRSKNEDGWRRVDAAGVSGETGWPKVAHAAVSPKASSLPWAAISINGRGWQGPVDDQFVERIQSYGP